MFQKLSKEKYSQVVDLFAPLAEFNLIVVSALDGNSDCEIFVDQVENPHTAFMSTAEGAHLVGKPTTQFISALRNYLDKIYFQNDEDALYLCVSDSWLNHVDSLVAGYRTMMDERQHYLCTQVAYQDWRQQVPDGYTVSPIDEQILNHPHLTVPEHIFSWIHANWDTLDNFYVNGLGFCVHSADQVVSWSIADCASGTRCEIGIRTHEDYRLRGLASITAVACVEYALSHGFSEVGWHCSADNIGSWKTAQKVGFVKERDYRQFIIANPHMDK